MKYFVATNTGKGFYTHADRALAHLSGHPGDVWAVGDANAAWGARVGGVEKSQAEAEAISLAAAQTGWDNNNQDSETAEAKVERIGARPTEISLPV
jgi:hypothetical protein